MLWSSWDHKFVILVLVETNSSVEFLCKVWSYGLEVFGGLTCTGSYGDSGNPSRRWRRGLEQRARTSKQITLFAIALAFLLLKFLALNYFQFIACELTFICAILTCLLYLLLYLCVFHHSISYINCSIISHTTRLHCAPLTHFKGNWEDGVQNPSRGIRLLVVFWEIVASHIHLSLKRALD